MIPYTSKWFVMVAVDNKLMLVGGQDVDRKDANKLERVWGNGSGHIPTTLC